MLLKGLRHSRWLLQRSRIEVRVEPSSSPPNQTKLALPVRQGMKFGITLRSRYTVCGIDDVRIQDVVRLTLGSNRLRVAQRAMERGMLVVYLRDRI